MRHLKTGIVSLVTRTAFTPSWQFPRQPHPPTVAVRTEAPSDQPVEELRAADMTGAHAHEVRVRHLAVQQDEFLSVKVANQLRKDHLGGIRPAMEH